MARNQKDFTYDNALLLKDTGAVTASAAAQVLAAAKQLDLGAARVDGRIILDISAIDVSSGDEKYEVEVQVSNTSGFGAGIVITAEAKLGHSSVSFESASTTIGRRELHFTNEVNGVTYRYLRLFHRIAGTTPTITYVAFAVLGAR